ncbi:hypothetical protein [Lacisediminimonas sp.]|nr:hypothetical protein [Lacisediminimonas sp.]MDO8299408.1 hypothetical protein [Lacisediminimonas sp.]MDO9216265.1 hypothetical protein [Lacisediminimonas sp.]
MLPELPEAAPEEGMPVEPELPAPEPIEVEPEAPELDGVALRAALSCCI